MSQKISSGSSLLVEGFPGFSKTPGASHLGHIQDIKIIYNQYIHRHRDGRN